MKTTGTMMISSSAATPAPMAQPGGLLDFDAGRREGRDSLEFCFGLLRCRFPTERESPRSRWGKPGDGDAGDGDAGDGDAGDRDAGGEGAGGEDGGGEDGGGEDAGGEDAGGEDAGGGGDGGEDTGEGAGLSSGAATVSSFRSKSAVAPGTSTGWPQSGQRIRRPAYF